jgi:hypothetical protein
MKQKAIARPLEQTIDKFDFVSAPWQQERSRIRSNNFEKDKSCICLCISRRSSCHV